MSMQIFNCEQNSPEWYACRLGIPTASMFKTVMASGVKPGTESKTRREYMLKLAGEIVTGQPMENYSNGYMERGKTMEAEARELYAFAHDCDPTQVGFIRSGDAGASPDSLIDANGLLEIKTKAPHLLIDLMFRDMEFVADHRLQCQGQLWIAEREWVDLACYYPGLPLFVKRAYRDEPTIREIANHVARFNDELAQVVEQVNRYGEKVAA